MVRPLDLVYGLGAALSAPWWARKARGDWGARFGRGASLGPSEGRRLLIHAVSVGEVNALRTLVPLLSGRCELVLSVGTDTGIERARALFADVCEVVRYPLDFSFAVRRFLDRVRPDAVGLVELELWPQFVRECRRRGAPVCVINGRLSAKSFKGYRRALRVPGDPVGRMFRSLSFAAVQDASYAERFRAMGVEDGACLVTGSMKWDAAPAPAGGPSEAALALRASLGIDPARPLVVGGSTAGGEEALLRDACPPGAQLLCAPRKPERFAEAYADLTADGGACVRRSGGAPAPGGADRFLLDTIGELSAAYQLADVVVMGRSFTQEGGSDPIEPAALGVATVVGPGMANFESIRDALREAGGVAEATPKTLGETLARLLGDQGAREALARAGSACVEGRRGASARHAELLVGLLEGGAEAGAGRGVAEA